jgi:hypothetical protein
MVSIRDNQQKHLKRHAVAMLLVRPNLLAGMTKIDAVMVAAWRKEAAP